jgi:uncharacterized membrane protein YadS
MARPPLLPLFVAAFLAAVTVRSLGLLPAGWLDAAKASATVLLTAALFALGTGVQVRRLLTRSPPAEPAFHPAVGPAVCCNGVGGTGASRTRRAAC